MKWNKIARINKSHSQLPVVLFIKKDLFKIFVTERFPNNESFIRSFNFNMATNEIYDSLMFACGNKGELDENGIMTSCIEDNNFYYTSWKKLKNKKYVDQKY